jgi:hypothetical protein
MKCSFVQYLEHILESYSLYKFHWRRGLTNIGTDQDESYSGEIDNDINFNNDKYGDIKPTTLMAFCKASNSILL